VTYTQDSLSSRDIHTRILSLRDIHTRLSLMDLSVVIFPLIHVDWCDKSYFTKFQVFVVKFMYKEKYWMKPLWSILPLTWETK